MGFLMSPTLTLALAMANTSMFLLVLSEGDVVPPQLVPVPGRCGYSIRFIMKRFDTQYRRPSLDGHLQLSLGLQVSLTGSAMLGLEVGKLKWQQSISLSLASWKMVLEVRLVLRNVD
jgi:hypothetical protein